MHTSVKHTSFLQLKVHSIVMRSNVHVKAPLHGQFDRRKIGTAATVSLTDKPSLKGVQKAVHNGRVIDGCVVTHHCNWSTHNLHSVSDWPREQSPTQHLVQHANNARSPLVGLFLLPPLESPLSHSLWTSPATAKRDSKLRHIASITVLCICFIVERVISKC